MANFGDLKTEHPRYFPGQYLLENDFKLQHKYLSDRQKYHNHSLHVSGIIEELDVEEIDDDSVKIIPGSAMDGGGNLIILTEEKLINLKEGKLIVSKQEDPFNEFNSLPEGELFIEYYSKSGLPQQTTDDTTHTRFFEEPIIKFAATTSVKGVKLAKLRISSDTITIDRSIREYSGLSLPNSDNKALTLRSGGHANPNLAVLTGSLKIEESLTVTKQLQIIDTNQDANGKTLMLGPSGRLRLGCHEDYSWIQSHGSKPLAINPKGNNVGIGTDDPGDYKLNVKGNQYLSGNLTVMAKGTRIEQEGWINAEINDNRENMDNPVGYFKDSLGIVHLKGEVKIKPTGQDTLFKLTESYRPSSNKFHPVAFYYVGRAIPQQVTTVGVIIIMMDGDVRVSITHTPDPFTKDDSDNWICLDGITFEAK